jgi:transposase
MTIQHSSGGPRLQKHHLGPHPIIRHYLERMNLRGVINGALGSGLHHSLDHAEVLAVLVHNILVSRGPMYRIKEWAEVIEPESLGLTAAQIQCLNDDRIARTLDALASERGRSIYFRLALRVIKDFELDLSRVHFDTTSVTLSGQYKASNSEPRIARGINKDHRPDLKQLLFGLNVAADGAVALSHHIFSGNRTDDSVHVRNTNGLRELLGCDDFIYVADSKLCTQKNMEHIATYGGRFVTVMPRTRKEDQDFRKQLRDGDIPVVWWKIHEAKNSRHKNAPPDIYQSTTAGPQKSVEGYRIVWLRSSQKMEFDRAGREERIRKAEMELAELASKVGRRGLRKRKAVKKRTRNILSIHKVTEYVEVRIVTFTEIELQRTRRGRPRAGDPVVKKQTQRLKIEVKRNKDAIRREERADGVFPLITNIEEAAKREILAIYKYQPYLEKRFELTKTEYDVAPIFLKKPARVVGLLHAYFVAIMVSSLIERQVRKAMKEEGLKKIALLPEGRESATPTTPRIMDKFARVEWHEFQEGGRHVNFPVELNKEQKLLLELADVPATLYQ